MPRETSCKENLTMRVTKEKLNAAKTAALKKIDALMEKFTEDFPSAACTNGAYKHDANRGGWTQCFYTGILFLAYELSGDKKYLDHAEKMVESFIYRVDNMLGMGDHDIGFTFTLSTVAAYKVTGKEIYREKSLDAARVLADRFREKGQFIQLVGDENVKDKACYRLIIDCLMNTNLLYWAGVETGDAEFTRKAFAHFNTTMETVVRANGSTFQNFYFDPATGDRLGGGTKQGFSDTSCWARGQSWGVTGVPFTYAYMKNDEILPKYYTIADYYLDHLPEDKVAYWDLDFTDGDEPRDTSAAAIAVCGLLAAVRGMPLDEAHKARYEDAADEIMSALLDSYTTKDMEDEGLLAHGTYYYAGKAGVDECCIFGDYFYMEALMRFVNPEWKKYW